MAFEEQDVPLNHILSFKEDMHSVANGESYSMDLREPRYEIPRHRGAMHSWIDTFRRDTHARITPINAFVGRSSLSADSLPSGRGRREHSGRNYFDIQAANYRTANPLLAKELKGRHLQMIAIGGSIGGWMCFRCPFFGLYSYFATPFELPFCWTLFLIKLKPRRVPLRICLVLPLN